MDEGCGDGGGGKNSGGGGGGAGLEEDVDVGDCSEEEEEEEEDMDMGSSPIAPDHSTIASMPSPAMPYEGLASPLRVGPVALPGGGKPVMRRGPGRPRTRGGVTQPQVRTKRPIGLKLKRWKGLLVSGVYGSGNGKTSQEGELDESTSPVQPSTPVEQQIKAPIFVDEPLFSEQWPGKLCILCNLSEHSQLGQGEMLRIECSIEDLPKDIPRDLLMSPPESLPHDSTSPRQPLQIRRHKGPSKCRNAGNSGQEPVDELSLVGHVDIPEPGNIVDTGYIYIHEWCAVWCAGVNRLSSDRRRLTNVGAGVMSAVSRRCWHCWRYGAGVACAVPNCSKHFHTPCAAASAAFQHPKTLLLICNQHIDQVATMPEFNDVSCQSCDVLGNVNNLVMCSICGNHYHGACIGNALHPGLRAGWQCADCRMCQLCRISTEDSTRMLVCEACDKTYHPSCVRPAMSSVPKVGWKCKRCRLCSDCGARTPGGGLSSRWHSNYTVCDSCYQQRNKGFSCPVCHKAYRAAALREMVRCSQCQRFVHGTCDKEADFVSYHRKKEAHPDYQYICLACKNNTTDKLLVLKRKDSTEEAMLESSLSVSQESLVMGDDGDLDSEKSDEAPLRLTIGLGKGKPFCASKMAKKRLGLGVGPGRPKGSGKMSAISPLSHYQKRSRFAEFGRKRGAKPKMRGIFGVPGVGLQRPQSDCSLKTEDEPGVENKLVLCSSKDKFVLGQDMCVMCGSVGIDQEACLISCAQCGQCYHPYCVSVKVTKVMLQKGWRCLDCTVCEGCGQRNDEGRLILCDDCDISYHIYCMDPPLGSVPTGVWKCKWCAQCQTCGSDNPGVNSSWQNSCTQCGPCASRTSCPACLDTYLDGDLIIKCINCDRWLHCMCDSINTEQEAEACCSQGYTCILCRPNNMALVVPPTPIRVPSPEVNPDTKVSGADYYVDGVCLSEFGLQQIKTLSMEHFQQPVRRKRPGFKRPQEADIMATIESVVTGDQENGEGKDTGYKEGMIWGSRENGPIPSPPEGFSLFTMESGMVILKRKKQRNLQKLGIGGFTAVKMRSSRFKDEDEGFLEDKPRRKPRCNKKRSKLAESYPSYLQEAFFGRDLLDTSKEAGGQDLESSSDESDDGKSNKVTHDKTIALTQDELKAIEDVKSKQDRIVDNIKVEEDNSQSEKHHIKEEDEGNDGEALKDILTIPDNLLHTDLVNTIMKEQDGEIKSENILPADSAGSETPQLNDSGASQKDELSDILGPHFNLESMVRETGLPNMDSKDVEEIFKGVLTDESQESQSSGVFPLRGPTPGHPQLSPQGIVPGGNLVGSRPISTLPSVVHSNSSPVAFPSASPYNSEYSNSPQFSPEGSPWGGDENGCSYNQRTSIKMESDEALGQSATISAVLYANVNHPEWRAEYPNWSERCKQILKKWRALSSEKKAPYLQQARENRTNLRMKKAQQIGKESSAGGANETERSATDKSIEVCPPAKVTFPQQGSSPTTSTATATATAAEQKLVSTASNTSPLHSPANETFPTTIPSHPSTIQYIPLSAPGIKATFHIIPSTIVTSSSSSVPTTPSAEAVAPPPPPLTRTIQYQYERSTIHYPPANVLLQPVPPLVVTTSAQSADHPSGLLQLIPPPSKATLQTPSKTGGRPSAPLHPPHHQSSADTTPATVTTTTTAASTSANSSPLSDQHIRVLTPSEIMRTLPSLGQETYDTSPSTEQDKAQAAKSCREAEQERQWKQLQAMRQQQVLTQNRPQGITKVTKQISSDGTIVQYTNETVSTQTHLTQQLQVSTTQDSSSLPVMSPRGPPQFTSPSGAKVVRPVVGTVVASAPSSTNFPRVLRPPQPTPPQPTFTQVVPTQQQQPPPPPSVRQPIPEEMNRQLRDLLQRHHTKQDTSDGSPLLSPTVVNAPLQSGATTQLRQPITQIRPQTLHHPASQGIDARVRLLLQQQRAAVFPGQVRLATPRPHVDQFNLMSRPQQFHAIASQNAPIVRASQPPAVPAEQVRIQPVEQRIQGREGEEIPDSVTAELEKLEQEGGNIAEVEAVSAILGDLVEDDDELLAEMGADFNILEYADPELDNVSGGEKTNIFDDLEDEVEKKKHLTENRQEKTEALVKREVFDRSKTTKKVEQSPAVRSQGGEKKTEATAVVNPSVVAVVSSTTPASQPQQNTLGTQGLPQVTVAGSASFSTQFAAPTTPIPRLPALQGGVQSTGRTQVLTGAQGQGFIQIPPPPPPYPGPPPPYPGQQMRVGVPRAGGVQTQVVATALPPPPHRRSLLLQELSNKMLTVQRTASQEQPLLLEELLEEEKREQEKQATVPQQSTGPALMSDADFEMLKADVLGTNPQVSSPPGAIQGPGLVPQPIRAPFVQRPPGTQQPQTIISRPPPPPPPPPPVETPAPPMPPDNIITEQDRQSQVQYEQWLHTNNAAVTQQLKFYETEVQKLRKVRKSLNSKQRQLRKNGNELSQRDAMELQRVTSEQAILQKYLEAARKQSRQHNMVIQEYQAKQEQKGGPGLMASGGGGGMVTVNINTGGSPQSPALMSPVLTPGGQAPMPSPQTPSVSPLHTTSPRLGTPLSQGGEDKNDTSGLPSPRPLQMTPTPPSPQQFTQRHPVMVSRFVRSPEAGMRPRMLVTQISGPSNTQVAYSAPRAFTSSPQPMSSIVVSQQNVTNQTIRLQAPQSLTPQQLLQRQQQLQQQKQQQLQQQEINQQEVSKQLQERPSLQQRQLTQEENLARQQQLHMLQRQQQLAQQNRQLLSQQGKVGQFRQILQQNQQQFTQVSHPLQSQSPLGQLQSGSTSPMVSQAQSPMPPSPIGSVQQFNTASSPMHPQSPMLPQFQPASSPMPQHSPRVQSYQTSNSPITPQSPMVYSGMQAPNSPMPQFSQPISPMPPQSPRVQQQQYTQQPPTSPMQQFPSSPMPPRSPMPHIGGSPMPMRRPSSTGGGSLASSPAERPRTPHDQQDPNCGGGGGGGNTNNPMNPIPFPPDFGRFGYFRLGLRGGSPMWGGKTPPKKPLSKSEPSTSVAHNSTDENGKMAHPMKAGSLVCLDYNDFDDESRTPPMTPPAKPALIKKAEAGGPKTRQSEDTDSEMTVYDDIVLVESCKEANLEVEELQSALKGNVMSTVVSMPVVLDPAQIQMMDVESDLLEDCLVSSDLVVLDVENGSAENDCILEVVDKETDEILILEEGIEEGLKVDESELMNNSEELMDLEEDLPSPPTGRKRMVGKVLPGEAIIKEDVKHIDDSPDSPEDDIADASPEPYLHSDMSSTKDDLFKSESHLKVQTKPRCQISEDVSSQENEDRKVINIQPNVVVSRTSVVPFTPMVTQKSYQICADRRLSLQQATVESLVQDAVNAAKLQRAAAVVSSAPEPIVNTTTNVVNSSNTVLTSVSSTVHNLSGQFIPLSVANKSDKTIKDNMVIVKECTKKDFEPHRNDTILVNMANSTCLDSNKILDRKVIHDGIKITDITDMKADLLANDKDLKNSHENETSSERVDKFQNDDSLFDTKFTRHPWDHSTFVNRERSKFDEQFHILNDGVNKIQTIKTTTNKILENKFEQDNSKEVAKPSNQNDDKEKLNVTLPCVNMSSSILEAQLTSMLRTTEQSSQPPKFVYTLINRTSTGNDVKKDVQINNDHDIHEDLRVEGLAAQFHRSIKSEELKLLADIKDETNKTTTNNNNRIQTNMKHASLYLPTSQIKSDTVVVGGKSYKIFQANSQASTSDILNICESSTADDSLKIVRSLENESPKNHLTDSVPKMTFQSSNARVHELLQQRVVSSSDKEARHISFSTAKVLHHQQKDEPKTFLQLSTMLMPQKKELPARTPEDSQNVLLKQLLQNTACATTTTAGASLSTGGGGGATVTTSGPIPPQAPPLPIVPSLEAQLARPVPPTPSALIPPALNEPVKNSLQQQQKEVKHLIKTQPMEPTRLSSLDELLSPSVGQLQPSLITSQSGLTSVTQSQPPTLPPPPPPPPLPPLPPQQQQQQHHHQQVLIKREPVTLTQPGPVMTTMVEVKKEPTPVTSPVVVEVKKEVISSDEMLSPGLRMEHEHAGEAALQDLKKTIKRRQYQQKRRQSLGKEAIGGTPKKRPRKSSKVEEDYDSFNDSLMSQLRQTPAMLICEPNLTYNFTASPIFGSGDLSKVNSSTRFGDLKGVYGAGYLPNENDYYNTLPFGDLPPHAPATPSTQRGFYNEEFAPLKLHSTKDEFDERKFDYNRERDNDTPDTVISSSSPECIMPEMAQRFPGLQLIDSEGEDDKFKISRFSPDIPIIAPLALRAKPCRMYSDMDKENEGPHGKRHCDVTVTLTLSTQASDDVLSVLRNLANVLRIPVPVNYSITERSITQPSQKLGLYRIKGKDGKEGVPVDIQSILNGAAKFCRHCDVIILNNLMKKKASEMPTIAKQGEEELYFCSSACYAQLAIAHPPAVQCEKVDSVDDVVESVPPKKIKLEDVETPRTEVKKGSPDSDMSESSLYIGTRSGKKEKYSEKMTSALIPSFKKSLSRYRIWTTNSIPPPSTRHKKPTDKEIAEMLFRLGITVQPPKQPDDFRVCLFCRQIGDGVTDGPARLLNYDVNKWVHLNCALWSDEVYETVSGGLVNVEIALQNGSTVNCAYCSATGATLKCFKMRCSLVYHLPCAVKDQCIFFKNKTLYCSSHVPKGDKENELTTLSVMRRVYISRDENRQVANVMHHSEQAHLMRVGSLLFLSVGQLLPHQLQAFHTPNYIYPIGYKILRMYWSMRVTNKRCRYVCSIHETEGRPEFRIVVQERGEPDLELTDTSARGVWLKVLEPLAEKRRTDGTVQLFPKFITGEDLFGLTEPAIVRVLESLPGVETLTDYRFKYGRNPLLELPLAINPTGCARCEGRPKGHWKRGAHTQRTCSSVTSVRPACTPTTPLGGGAGGVEAACPYSKQFVHSKSSQYKKMKQEWRNNVYLARSKIQGLGLYAARDLERHTMVIEYIGEIIRTELAETREKQYEAKNRGIYMFRLDEDRVVDATLCGGLARYINHSCSPNCVAETVEVDRDVRIIIFTKRRINRGEELAYDYKFDIEDDQHKIPCNCGAPNCRKWMN